MKDAEGSRADLLSRFPELTLLTSDGWVVGGAVRDTLLGRPSPDVDLAVRNAEEAAGELARKTGGRLIPLGRGRFPTWRVVIAGRSYDVSDLTEGSLESDLARRDFTINALAMPVQGSAEFVDPHGGRGDIEARVVRMIRRENFEDDPLRVLKAVRMAAVLRFTLDPATLKACRELASGLARVAAERIGTELETLLTAGDPAIAAALLRRTGLDELLLERPVPPALAELPAGDPVLAWAAIYREADRNELRRVASILRWRGDLAASVTTVLDLDRALGEATMTSEELDVLLFDAGEPAARRVATLRESFGDQKITGRIRQRIRERGESLFLVSALLSGDEIAQAAGLAPGPRVGSLKRDLLLAQIRGEVRTREQALAWIAARG